MGYKDYGQMEDLPSGVKYNDGWFQVIRINEVKRIVNACKINPTSFNNEYGMWNFELWFNNMSVILDEVWFKLKTEEIEKIERLKNAIMVCISSGKVIQELRQKSYPYRNIKSINKKEWVKLNQLLSSYDHLVRDYMNQHGFGNPDRDEEADLLLG